MASPFQRLRPFVIVAGICVSSCVAACSPGYVLRAAYEQGKILSARRSIADVLKDPATPAEQREKLQIVLDARAFAESKGLNPGDSFTTYASVSRDPLAWVVVASRKDSFLLRTWWFPIVGRVPYKGFFDKEDAERQLNELVQEGYEGSMRGTEAFSTLGWFNDPVMSTTLKNNPVRIANTVIHESVHSTVWIPSNVNFNESLANFVGSVASVEFWSRRVEECESVGAECSQDRERLEAARKDEQAQYELSGVIDELYGALEVLYGDSALTTEEKVARRVPLFFKVMAPFYAKYPKANVLREVNNADIMQLKLYLTKLGLFKDLYTKVGGDLGRFIDTIRQVESKLKEDSSKDPFVVLRDIVGKAP